MTNELPTTLPFGLWVSGKVLEKSLANASDPKAIRLNLTLDINEFNDKGEPKYRKVVANGYVATKYKDVMVGDTILYKFWCKVAEFTPPGQELVHYVQYNIKVDYKPKATGGSSNDDTMDDNFL